MSILSVGREKRRVAWGETPYEDQTKEKTKGVKKFSENRSKTQRGGPTRNALCGNVQKHRSSEDWRSSRNITEKEPKENNISKDGGRFISSLRPVFNIRRILVASNTIKTIDEMTNLIELHYLLFELLSTRPKFDI